MQVLARRRRERADRARAELALARRTPGGGAAGGRQLSVKEGAGYRAGYHTESTRGANPKAASPWEAVHRLNVHDGKVAQVRRARTQQP
jgi:hypothetical protein